jgi:hypothetical protein
MKVFISWSGERSKQLAEVIHWWLPNVMQFTKPYFTPSDIEKGAKWDSEISEQLGRSTICIIAMTEESLTSPWIMFEAGAISRVVKEKARVCPIVFGIAKTDLVGPLASFQATEFNRTEVRQLLTTINNAAAKEVALPEQRLDAAFDVWWDKLKEKVEAISSAQPPSEPQRSERDLLEEAVSNTRAILRELQVPRPLQVFAPNREMEAYARALLRGNAIHYDDGAKSSE